LLETRLAAGPSSESLQRRNPWEIGQEQRCRGVNFGLAGAVAAMGTLGTPIALTAIAFVVGLLIIPFATETRGEALPE
jgi:hypothetical protein